MRWSRWILIAAGFVGGTAVAQVGPPPSAIDPVVDRYGNTRIVDDYRWLEQADSSTKHWVQQQNAYSRSFLDRLPDREAIGTPTDKDVYELGDEFSRLAEIRLFNREARWQFARIAVGDEPRFSFYASTPRGRWFKFLAPDDDVVQVSQAGNRLLLLSTKRAPRGEVLALKLRGRGPDQVDHASRFAEQPAVAAIQSIIQHLY